MRFKLFLLPVLFLLFPFIVLGAVKDFGDNITSAWSFDSDFTADVDNGTNFDGTQHGGTVIASTNCVFNDCAVYDGTSDVQIPNLPLNREKGTICLLYQRDSAGVFDFLIGNDVAATAPFTPIISLGEDNTYNFIWRNVAGSGDIISITGVGDSSDTTSPHQVCAFWNTTNSELWKDGVRIGTGAGSAGTLDQYGDGGFFIGHRNEDLGSNGIDGMIDEVMMWNVALPDAEKLELYNSGSFMAVSEIQTILTLQEFTLTAKDTYDSVSITNISVTVKNGSFSFNDSTVNGTLLINNVSVPSFNKLYDITFRSNDTGGYFNRTFFNINISSSGSKEGDLFQSVLKLTALDGLNNQTISIFSARTNQSFDTTTNGEILILIKNGNFQLNVTASGFDKLVTNFSIKALQNNSLNVSMGSIFTFKLVREETNTPFDFNSTNSTNLNIFCPNETIRISFNTSNNISQIINCQFTLMQIVVDYGVLGSYFRTLIPTFSQKNITWYLIDLLAGDIAIQKVIQLVDLTGDFSGATLRVKRAIPGETTLKTMIEQKFDISSEVNLFLVKDVLYTINIENDVEDIALGNLIPTEAGTQTITLPKIDFVPQETILGDNISWSYTFNATQGILRLQYVDKTKLTTLVRFTVRNGSDTNLKQLFQAESDNNSTVTMTFNQVKANNSYVSELFFVHPGLSNFTELRPWYEFIGEVGALNLEGWSDSEQITFKKWGAWFFIAIWGMFFSRRYVGIGMTTMAIWLWIFRTLKWIDVTDVVFGFVVLLAVVGWMVEAMKKE